MAQDDTGIVIKRRHPRKTKKVDDAAIAETFKKRLFVLKYKKDKSGNDFESLGLVLEISLGKKKKELQCRLLVDPFDDDWDEVTIPHNLDKAVVMGFLRSK